MTIPKWVRYPLAAVFYVIAALYTYEVIQTVIILFDDHPVFTGIMFLCGPFLILFGGLLGFTWSAFTWAMEYAEEASSRWGAAGRIALSLLGVWILPGVILTVAGIILD